MLGMGSGQPNRLESLRIAFRKAGAEARGAALASDAFFPFGTSLSLYIYIYIYIYIYVRVCVSFQPNLSQFVCGLYLYFLETIDSCIPFFNRLNECLLCRFIQMNVKV